MSAMGMRWPGARNGKKRMCSGGCCSSLAAMVAASRHRSTTVHMRMSGDSTAATCGVI
jgi:hypothetical protein